MNIWEELPAPFFVLAPMDDVTDTVFRRVIAECATPDLFYTEFVNVDGLQSPGRPALLKKLQFTLEEQPLIAQLWGKEPDNYYKTARQMVDGSLIDEVGRLNRGEMRALQGDAGQDVGEKRTEAYRGYGEGVSEPTTQSGAPSTGGVPASRREQASTVQGYAGIDINMGCPVKVVIKNGCCSALIDNRDLAGEIILAVKRGADGRLPLSVKTRLGMRKIDLSWHEFLLGFGLDALIIHGRTAKHMSDVPADWEVIGKIRELRDKIAPQTKIVGNGDVVTRQQGIELARQYGLDGIMIGRGVFQSPFVFSKEGEGKWEEYGKEDKIALFRRHVELFMESYQNGERKTHTLNKFCKVYINGFDGAKELREQCMQAQSAPELLNSLKILTA